MRICVAETLQSEQEDELPQSANADSSLGEGAFGREFKSTTNTPHGETDAKRAVIPCGMLFLEQGKSGGCQHLTHQAHSCDESALKAFVHPCTGEGEGGIFRIDGQFFGKGCKPPMKGFFRFAACLGGAFSDRFKRRKILPQPCRQAATKRSSFIWVPP